MSAVSQFPPSHLVPEESANALESATSQGQDRERLALPAPAGDAAAQETREAHPTTNDDDGVVKFDGLGPLVVNQDGTLSRIHNWPSMTAEEQARTLRVVNKRNQTRMQALRDSTEKAN